MEEREERIDTNKIDVDQVGDQVVIWKVVNREGIWSGVFPLMELKLYLRQSRLYDVLALNSRIQAALASLRRNFDL